MACRFALWALSALFFLSCSQEPPVSSPSSASAEESGPWQTVSINGATYRRVAAKPTETSQADLLITIPISYEIEGGLIRFSDTVQIAGRTYTADCSSTGGDQGNTGSSGDDVGNTRDSATALPVPYPPLGSDEIEWFSSSQYEMTRGDIDYFRLVVTKRVWLGVLSSGTTDVVGELFDSNGLLLDADDNGRVFDDNNFILLVLVDPGTYYVKITGAGGTATGSYTFSLSTSYPDGAGKAVVSQRMSEQLKKIRR